MSDEEMVKTFNCGIGFVMVTGADNAESVRSQTGAQVVGTVQARSAGTYLSCLLLIRYRNVYTVCSVLCIHRLQSSVYMYIQYTVICMHLYTSVYSILSSVKICIHYTVTCIHLYTVYYRLCSVYFCFFD